jgi:predicted ATPase
MLEFVRSLVDEGLLEYSICKKRWIWDEMAIQSKEITNNVLFLLANKMNNGLTKETISVLKVVSCFGIRIHESVINFLSATAEYSNIREGLAELVWESFMVKIAQNCRGSSYNNGWKFVHDKVSFR